MVRRRRRARQILVRHPAGRHLLRAAGGAGQAALAHRGGMAGPQAGGGPGSLRRPKLARLPPPRQPLDRRLRIPDLRAGDDSPPRTSFLGERRAGCPTRRLSTPRRRRSDPNGTSPTLSPPCAGVSSWLSSDDCRDVHAARPRAANTNANDGYDAVRLGIDEMRVRALMQRLVMDQHGGAEPARLAVAECPLAAVAIGGAEIGVEIESAVMGRDVRPRAVNRTGMP